MKSYRASTSFALVFLSLGQFSACATPGPSTGETADDESATNEEDSEEGSSQEDSSSEEGSSTTEDDSDASAEASTSSSTTAEDSTSSADDDTTTSEDSTTEESTSSTTTEGSDTTDGDTGACEEGDERPCTLAEPVGECTEGVETCAADGTWSACGLSEEDAAACEGPSDCDGYVGITYDDGPVNTTAFVNALRDAGLVPVTFFVNGSQIASNPGAIEQMLTVGEVQSHGFTHTNLGSASADAIRNELEQNNDAIMGAGAPMPTIFRPPYGATSGTMTQVATELDMIVITWDVDSQDWNGASASAIVMANDRMTDGQVILMHENQNQSLQAIPQIAATLAAKRLCPGLLDPTTGRAVAP